MKYSTNLTDKQWKLIEPVFRSNKWKISLNRLNAILSTRCCLWSKPVVNGGFFRYRLVHFGRGITQHQNRLFRFFFF